MKEKTKSIIYYLLMFIVGLCLIIGAIINVKKHKSYLIIAGGATIGIGMIILAVKGFTVAIKSNVRL